MELIEDLGLKPIGNKEYKQRYGLYECPVCGRHFECRTGHVKSGATTKCRICASKVINAIKSALADYEFIEKALAIHEDLYDYIQFIYINNSTKGAIKCKVCNNIFEQSPGNHLSGKGCPNCAESGFNKSKPAIVYYIKILHSDTIVYKIGITNRTVQERFNNIDLKKIQILKIWDYLIGAEAYSHEQQILKQYKDFQYVGEPLLHSGNTELFILDVLGLDN